uniref:Tubby C-terminal domain-containing protein n=1 Tax=Globisporangium ultimum (strain ATCC 200006 / CBS 805.95 / DAOM BR144) TaxID=431595 RepID=K3WY53_GLOUD
MTLIPQAQPVAAINSVFCNPGFITLHLHQKYWSLSGDDFAIKDVNTGRVWFRIECKAFSVREKKTLLDCNDVPIVNMKEEFFSLVPGYKVYAGKDSNRLLFDIAAKFSIFETFLRIEFTNVVTGQRCRMGLEGDWRNRKALIWLDRGMTGIREPVGKVFRPLSTGNNLLLGTQDYYLEVAPNVDVALMTLICIVLDEKATD